MLCPYCYYIYIYICVCVCVCVCVCDKYILLVKYSLKHFIYLSRSRQLPFSSQTLVSWYGYPNPFNIMSIAASTREIVENEKNHLNHQVRSHNDLRRIKSAKEGSLIELLILTSLPNPPKNGQTFVSRQEVS
jgi:hypothetical protein